MESLLVEKEVLLRQIGITAEMCYNFRSDRWMDLNVLHSFLETVFLEVPMESLLVEEEVLSRQTGISAEKGHNF
jgi:hypothetical protein